jgi:hypothetical protein
MSTLAQKRLKIFNVAQKGPKKLSLSLTKFLLGNLIKIFKFSGFRVDRPVWFIHAI